MWYYVGYWLTPLSVSCILQYVVAIWSHHQIVTVYCNTVFHVRAIGLKAFFLTKLDRF
jgi:hypothetical protein